MSMLVALRHPLLPVTECQLQTTLMCKLSMAGSCPYDKSRKQNRHTLAIHVQIDASFLSIMCHKSVNEA
jgi:hypothetical protein